MKLLSIILLCFILSGCEKEEEEFECPLIITKIELHTDDQARYTTGSCVGGGNFIADKDLYGIGDTIRY